MSKSIVGATPTSPTIFKDKMPQLREKEWIVYTTTMARSGDEHSVYPRHFKAEKDAKEWLATIVKAIQTEGVVLILNTWINTKWIESLTIREMVYMPEIGYAGALNFNNLRWVWSDDQTEAIFDSEEYKKGLLKHQLGIKDELS